MTSDAIDALLEAYEDATDVQNIDALKGLSGLQELYLANNTPVQDIEVLKGLTGLRELVLYGTRAKNVDELKAALPNTRVVW
ncbi:UNVERIFIED_ORG: Leucine-rich repeat (LRR) protein [Burkholderia contaminans]|nr:Leucine-rich repeat (LRR) protein [Burkholderia contaminans]